MARVPQVEEDVAGTGVETSDGTSYRQVGDVGDAADIDDDAVTRSCEKRRVKGGDQRRAFAAGRDIAAAKVGDDGDSRTLGYARRVVELQRPASLRDDAAASGRGHPRPR